MRRASESIKLAEEALELVHDAQGTRAQLRISPLRHRSQSGGQIFGSSNSSNVGYDIGSQMAPIFWLKMTQTMW